MNIDDILGFYHFNVWANKRFLSAVEALPSEMMAHNFKGSFRSIRDVLAHIISAEWIWLERWQGRSPNHLPDWVASGDFSVLAAHLAGVASERAEFLRHISEPMLGMVISFTYLSGVSGRHTLADALLHVINHSTYHRGQLASMIREAGGAPPFTDFIVYKAESAT